MQITKMTAGEYRIVASGTFISFGDKSSEVYFKTLDGETQRLTFVFKKDEQNKKSGVQVGPGQPGQEDQILVELINVPNAFGGNDTPMEIAKTSRGKRVVLNIRSMKTGDSYSVFFTLYEEE